MNPISSLIASTGLCSARAFVPAFIAALMLRLWPDNPQAAQAAGDLVHTLRAPTWFTSDWCLVILGLLSALEIAAQRSHDARSLLAEIDHWVKPVMGAVTALGLVGEHDAAFIQSTATQHAGVTGLTVAAISGATTYAVARARNDVHQFLHDADSENATGIHSVLAWAEDFYAAFGMVAVVLFPVLVAGVIGLGIGVLFLLQKRAHAREDASRTPCPRCRAPMYRSALVCPSCKAPNPLPCRVNWLGVATAEPADAARQPFALLTKRRCPACATRLPERTPRQNCPACAAPGFADAAAVNAYDSGLQERLLPTLGLCALLGLVPVLGVIAGVLFYRIHLISPYRAYVPRGRAMLLRWGLRLLMFILIALQLVPGVGLVTVPMMALLNYLVYRRAFRALAAS